MSTILIIIILMILFIHVTEPFGLINQDTELSRNNPSAAIAPEVLQTGYTGCGKIDYARADPEQLSKYYTCLNQMKSVAIKQLSGIVGASPNS